MRVFKFTCNVPGSDCHIANGREDKVTRCQCVHPLKYEESLRQDMYSLFFKFARELRFF